MNVAETPRAEVEASLLAAVRAGDESSFAQLTEPYRRQLHVHCYRMLGSFDEAEDLVQETLLRAWNGRAGFEGRSLVRTWLYRIATNACLDALERSSRRRAVDEDAGAAILRPSPDLLWIQPYPDVLLDEVAPSEWEPEAMVISRETIELAYLTAIQLLPPRQRAILILRDSLGWSAKETAALLELSVASVNSHLKRARSALRTRLPAHGQARGSATEPTNEDRVLLGRYMTAHDRLDVAGLTALLREDARQTMPPYPTRFEGRVEIANAFAYWTDPHSSAYQGQFRLVPTAANRQPAVAGYVRRPGDSEYRAIGIDVLRIEDGLVIEVTRFVDTRLFAAFGFPLTL